jgi:hypothetical protein
MKTRMTTKTTAKSSKRLVAVGDPTALRVVKLRKEAPIRSRRMMEITRRFTSAWIVAKSISTLIAFGNTAGSTRNTGR